MQLGVEGLVVRVEGTLLAVVQSGVHASPLLTGAFQERVKAADGWHLDLLDRLVHIWRILTTRSLEAAERIDWRVVVALSAACGAFEHGSRLLLGLARADGASVLAGFVEEAQLADHFLDLIEIRPHLRLVCVEILAVSSLRAPGVKLICVEEWFRICGGFLPTVTTLLEHWGAIFYLLEARVVPPDAVARLGRELGLGSESEVGWLVVRQGRRLRTGVATTRHRRSVAARLR